VILTGIPDFVTRGDLADRAIVVTASPMPEEKRRRERDLWADFERVWPSVLGGLLDAVSCAIRRLPNVEGPYPRMADFAAWVVAAEPACWWEPGAFLEAYADNRRNTVAAIVDAMPLAPLVLALPCTDGVWEGTASKLHYELSGMADKERMSQDWWPKDATRLAGELRRLAPALRAERSLAVTFSRANGVRTIRVQRIAAHRNPGEDEPR